MGDEVPFEYQWTYWAWQGEEACNIISLVKSSVLWGYHYHEEGFGKFPLGLAGASHPVLMSIPVSMGHSPLHNGKGQCTLAASTCLSVFPSPQDLVLHQGLRVGHWRWIVCQSALVVVVSLTQGMLVLLSLASQSCCHGHLINLFTTAPPENHWDGWGEGWLVVTEYIRCRPDYQEPPPKWGPVSEKITWATIILIFQAHFERFMHMIFPRSVCQFI